MNPDDARVNAEPEATDQSRLKSTLSLWPVSGSKKVIFYALTWEYDVTSVRFRMKFFFKIAIPDHARVKSESNGPIPTEIDLTGGS